MLWTKEKKYYPEYFESEDELECAILKTSSELFGDSRIYLDCKKRIGKKGKIINIPDGYLLDLSSSKEPKLYVVENEIAKHDPLRHIAVQILQFSLSFETSQHLVKDIIKEALSNDGYIQKCQKYAEKNGFENVDYLLEQMIFGENRFNALVIIDELSEELEKVLISRFQFPVEIVTLERFKSKDGVRIYKFDPFLSDISVISIDGPKGSKISQIDPAEIDTIVVPAREEGFQEVFINENCWYAIRIHSSMIPKLKNIAVYRVAPESAITHIAPIKNIEKWKDTSKYVVNFSDPAKKIKSIKLIPKGNVKAPQAPRYTTAGRIKKAKTLDDVF